MAKAVRAEVLSQLRCPVADIRIGVSASGQGATICIMQPYADGSTTTIYSEMHPLGDSMGRATLVGAPKAPNAPKATQEYKLRAMARNTQTAILGTTWIAIASWRQLTRSARCVLRWQAPLYPGRR